MIWTLIWTLNLASSWASRGARLSVAAESGFAVPSTGIERLDAMLSVPAVIMRKLLYPLRSKRVKLIQHRRSDPEMPPEQGSVSPGRKPFPERRTPCLPTRGWKGRRIFLGCKHDDQVTGCRNASGSRNRPRAAGGLKHEAIAQPISGPEEDLPVT